MDTKNIGMGIASGFLGGIFGINSRGQQMENQEYLMGLQHKYNEQSADAAQKRAYEMWKKTNYAAQDPGIVTGKQIGRAHV